MATNQFSNLLRQASPIPLIAPSQEQIRKAEARNLELEVDALDLGIAKALGDNASHAESEIPPSAKPKPKLTRLVDEDFPFDESQLAAVEGLLQGQYGCLTGAAGTGKTKTTQKLVDVIINDTEGANLWVDMTSYWKKPGADDKADEVDSYSDPDEEYVASPTGWVPSIAMAAFTGQASQMIKENFPRDWHPNIMTIHRCLGFYPESYSEIDEETGELRNKRRFVPLYNADYKMPWDILILDESGMIPYRDLWLQLWAACKSTTRIYMVGDINQLDPVQGRSIFGYALATWPAFELTHLHRQVGKDNAIVDNAWRVLEGKMPIEGGNFKMIELKAVGSAPAAAKLKAIIPAIRDKGIYEPNRDAIITPINGYEEGATGYHLGQYPLNEYFANVFNPESENPRYFVDGGMSRKLFAVGDRVMATKNDHEAGITNGMKGIIESIEPNPGYRGDRVRFGKVRDVNEYMANFSEEDDFKLTMADLDGAIEEIGAQAKEKDKKDRGPSSHIITVRFGKAAHSFTISFGSLSEVGSLMLAYASTCHKLQGGAAPVILIVMHDSLLKMLYREWVYTAITRASKLVILFYTTGSLRGAIAKQKIPGRNLKEKIQFFKALMTDTTGRGAPVDVVIPKPNALVRGSGQGQEIKGEKLQAEGESAAESIGTELAIVQPAAEIPLAQPVSDSRAVTVTDRMRQMLEKAKADGGELRVNPTHIHVHVHPAERVVEERVEYVWAEAEPQPIEVDCVDITPEKLRPAKQTIHAMLGFREAKPLYRYDPQLLLTHDPYQWHDLPPEQRAKWKESRHAEHYAFGGQKLVDSMKTLAPEPQVVPPVITQAVPTPKAPVNMLQAMLNARLQKKG